MKGCFEVEYRFSGKTIEEAVDNACRELNAEKGSFSYEVEDYRLKAGRHNHNERGKPERRPGILCKEAV